MLKTISNFFDKHLLIKANESTQDKEHALKLATASLLIEMTRADYEVKSIEIDHILSLLKSHFEMTEEETTELIALAESEADQAIGYHDFTALINQHYQAEQKIRMIELLWEVAYSDGEIEKYEDHLVRKIAELLHVPHKEFIAAKLRIIDKK